jgi:DNA/RNA endonuclease G (NUC1)
VTPGTNPTSAGLGVTVDLSSIGGSGAQQFFDNGTNGDVTAGNNVFSYNAAVSLATTPGAKILPFAITDAQLRNGGGNISLTVTSPPVPPGTVVISQLYGGGGNVGAVYTNDFVEIFNRSTSAVNLAGWSVQYASATGTSWQATPLTGTIAPGQYYLVQLSAGAGNGVPLPTPNATGSINMSATTGKVALSSSTSAFSGCPLGNISLMDLVGYGTATCFEGAGPAPGIANETADFRTHSGCKDTDSNGGNFVEGNPSPRNTSSPTNACPAGDFPPEIFGTSPTANEAHVPQDANITINFDEPVNVAANWYQISCASTGLHTAAVTGGPVSFTLNPDSDFTFNEPCTVTIFATQVSDQDINDPPDNMAADYVFTFNSEFQRDPAEHMLMGNPSNATKNVGDTTNYLMMKLQYALSYNNNRYTPNWTSWHLDSSWRGSAPRQDDFRADSTLPPGYHQVQGGAVSGETNDYSGSGFDRGHMCPSADRTSTIPDNSATFLMTNMVPQAPGNNQGPWANFENALRAFLPSNELYILSGGAGVGGIGESGAASVLASGVTVPNKTWKAALILPVGDNDISRVDNNTRIIAVIMPNDTAIRPDDWKKYLATVDQIEALTGYDLYSNVPTGIQAVIEARVDAASDTAPVTTGQTKTVAEDGSVGVILTATDFNVNNTFTYTVVDQPLHGSIVCAGANCTYSPTTHYFGPDQFTFRANDSALDSNVSTVTITVTEVNNNPIAVNDNKTTPEDSGLNFGASDLSGNDSAGPGEGSQTLTVDSVISTANTHGAIVLSAGQITYTPDANYNGPASFDYHVCDNGTTNGSSDPKCTIGTVTVTVTEVNDGVTANNDSKGASEDTTLTFAAGDLTGNDSAGPANESGQSLTVTMVTATASTHGTVSQNSGQISYAPAADYNGPASFEYQVCDNGTTNGVADTRCATATVNVTVSNVNDTPIAVADSKNAVEDNSLSFSAADLSTNDSAGPANENGQTLTVSSVTATANTHGTVSLSGGTVIYTSDADYNGPADFEYEVCDNGTTNGSPDSKCATGTVNVQVSEVNDSPSASADSKSTDEDTALNFSASDLTGNDGAGPANESGQTLTVTSATANGNTHGTVTLSGGQITYTPAADYNGPASFNYEVCDNGTTNGTLDAKCASGIVNVTVNSINDNPVAVADSANTNEDNSVTIDVVTNDTDVDGNSLTLSSVGTASHGSVSIVSGKAFYSPAANYNGGDAFTYVVSDGHGGEATGNVSVTVDPVNDAPMASGQSVNADSNTPVAITLTGSDLETPSAGLTYAVTSGPNHGNLSGTGANRTYTPALNYSGPDSFTFTVRDTGDGSSAPLTSSPATVSITVNDTVGPTITLIGNSISLWPANHDYYTINVSDLVASASDNFDPNVNLSSVVIAKVTSDEAENGNGSGNTLNDIVIAANCKSVQLRAEHEGGGDGRVYTITFLVKDAAGNTTTTTATITVPHNQGGAAVDSGPHYTVNGTCP